MLYEFIDTNRDELVARTRSKVAARPRPSASTEELENGVALFLEQLSETLPLETSRTPFSPSLDFHGGAQRGSGLTFSRPAGRLRVTRSR